MRLTGSGIGPLLRILIVGTQHDTAASSRKAPPARAMIRALQEHLGEKYKIWSS